MNDKGRIIGQPVVISLNVKKILAVINATHAVAKRKPEKIRLARICDTGAAKI